MSKKGENITKRKDGRYEARFVKERDEFGRITKYGFVYAKSYLEVKQKRDIKLKSYEKDNYKNLTTEKENFTISIGLWLDSKILLKDSSYTNYYSIIYSKIVPFFENIRIIDINENKILEFIKYLKGQKLENKRIKDILLVLKQFLLYKKINVKIKLPKTPQKKIITLTDDEIVIIEKATKNSNDIKVFAILLVLFSGLRIGELCALTWKDIDINNKLIHINKTLIRVKNKDSSSKNKTRIIIDTPKTQNSIRDIPINQVILPYLEKFRKDETSYFLTGNSEFMTTKKYYMFYLNFLKSLSIKKYKFHILRHTFATHSLMCGVDIKSLSEILGHSSVKTTLDLYVHISDNEKLFQINKLTFLNLSKS